MKTRNPRGKIELNGLSEMEKKEAELIQNEFPRAYFVLFPRENIQY